MTPDQQAQRDLVIRMCERAGLSLTELARRAGVAHTTLTRFMNKPVDHMMTARTLAKLYRASGMHPELPDGAYLIEEPDQIMLLMLWETLSATEKKDLLGYAKRLKRATERG